jgi:hypothetical integral membrane protein (TIGR02206 family)
MGGKMLFTPGSIAFELFGTAHIGAILTLLALYFSLFSFRRILSKPEIDYYFRMGIIIFLVIEEIAFNAYRITNGIWTLSTSLPLHYCNLLVWTSIYLMYSKNRTAFEIVYLLGLAGASQAIMTPAIQEGFPHFRFIQFYAAHGMIIFSGLYFVFVHNYKPDFSSVKRVFILLNLSVPPLLIINWLTGGNYNNLSRVPEFPTLIDHLGPWPFYLIPLEFLAIFFLLLAYFPFALQNWRAKKELFLQENKLKTD